MSLIRCRVGACVLWFWCGCPPRASPLFVTWEIEEQGGTHLRGCIGTLAPTRLRNLRDFTFKSALRDRRFDPIGPQELHRLHCSVSLLIDYQDAESFDDWEVGGL